MTGFAANTFALWG